MMNMLVWKVIVLVRLQLIKELRAFGRNLQKTDHCGGGSSLRNFFCLGFIDPGDPVLKKCIRYCFMESLRQELNDFTERWSRYLLASSKGAILPRGSPISLYHLPKLFGSASWLISASSEDIAEFDDLLFTTYVPQISPEFQEFADIVLEGQDNFRDRPANITETLEMCFMLVVAIAFYG